MRFVVADARELTEEIGDGFELVIEKATARELQRVELNFTCLATILCLCVVCRALHPSIKVLSQLVVLNVSRQKLFIAVVILLKKVSVRSFHDDQLSLSPQKVSL